ncbi:hypothetical protein EJB05_10553, partial [Eragrostis curvula]
MQRTVAAGLANRSWIRDIVGGLTVPALIQYLKLWERLRFLTLNEESPDRLRWRWTPDDNYSSKSAYLAMFHGSIPFPGAELIWKAWCPSKVKMFAWIAMQHRLFCVSDAAACGNRRRPRALAESVDGRIPRRIQAALLDAMAAGDQHRGHPFLNCAAMEDEATRQVVVETGWRRLPVSPSPVVAALSVVFPSPAGDLRETAALIVVLRLLLGPGSLLPLFLRRVQRRRRTDPLLRLVHLRVFSTVRTLSDQVHANKEDQRLVSQDTVSAHINGQWRM